MIKKPVIFFLSKSGAGKDTQAELLIQKFKYDYINSGDLLRAVSDARTIRKFSKESAERYEAEEIGSIINSGKFVPTLTIMWQWRRRILELVMHNKKCTGIVLVGSPRKIGEALALHDFFETWPDAEEHFCIIPIYLKVSDKEVRLRLFARRQCVKCKKIIFLKNAPTKNCASCGGKLIRRKDDNQRGIASRLKEYREFVVPVLKYFQKHKILIEVNGEQSVEQVHREVVRKLHLQKQE